MKKRKLIISFVIYYVTGFVLFTMTAYLVHIVFWAILTSEVIAPLFDIKMCLQTLFYFLPWYIIVYTAVYGVAIYVIHRHDIYVVKKLNEKLNGIKGDGNNE